MIVHCIQTTSVDNTNQNLEMIEDLCGQIKATNSSLSLTCLPENALHLRIKESEPIVGLELSDPIFKRLSKLAKKINSVIHIGSSPIKTKKKLVNASIIIHPDDPPELTYEKIHLFDIQLENGLKVKESDIFQHGVLPSTFDLGVWQFGQTICYDLRFSELYNFYARISVDAILVPSAFLVPTGEAHWHTLLQARAIESQCYIIAAAQAGEHCSGNNKRSTFGHSLIIDPWGTIIGEGSSSKPEVISSELSKDRIASVRRQIPMHHHRRWHL